jgi:hypothetical protein
MLRATLIASRIGLAAIVVSLRSCTDAVLLTKP